MMSACFKQTPPNLNTLIFCASRPRLTTGAGSGVTSLCQRIFFYRRDSESAQPSFFFLSQLLISRASPPTSTTPAITSTTVRMMRQAGVAVALVKFSSV